MYPGPNFSRLLSINTNFHHQPLYMVLSLLWSNGYMLEFLEMLVSKMIKPVTFPKYFSPLDVKVHDEMSRISIWDCLVASAIRKSSFTWKTWMLNWNVSSRQIEVKFSCFRKKKKRIHSSCVSSQNVNVMVWNKMKYYNLFLLFLIYDVLLLQLLFTKFNTNSNTRALYSKSNRCVFK